jgi:Tudor domain
VIFKIIFLIQLNMIILNFEIIMHFISIFTGVVCVVRKDPSSEWMRGIVRNIVGNPEATNTLFEVMSLDCGSIFCVTRFNIRRYLDQVKFKFMEVPPLAMPCRLHGLRPRWTGNKTKDERQKEISYVLRFGEQ